MKKVHLVRLLLVGCLCIAGFLGCQQRPLAEQVWQVVPNSVHDGDTLRVRRGNQQIKVRFACTDAPELQQPMGKASRDYLRSLLARSGNQVRLNIVDTDRYGRKVAEVFTPDGQLVQEQQLKSGMAYVFERYLGKCATGQRLKQAQNLAKRQHLGVWASQQLPPWEFRKLAKQ